MNRFLYRLARPALPAFVTAALLLDSFVGEATRSLAVAAGFAGLHWGVGVFALLPLSLILARPFALT